jgi:hypothetical protein
MDKTQHLRDLLDAAERALRLADIARREAVRHATDAVHAEYAPHIADCRANIEAAQAALNEHLEQKTSHPWDGKIVWKDMRILAPFSSKIRTVRTRGIVEVVRSTSKFPVSMKYGRPRVGDVIIRAIKKDGTPSLKVEAHNRLFDVTEGWTLEDQADGE